ncbi:MAG TPA: pyridoxamine 5'-phosphate oxidase family protein [Planctomycetota bacterium]|nr:pyridoxamine 5'-phosphate oxidase family protein [Planctomycetota bacterium]
MDSTSRNPSEPRREDLQASAAVAKIRDLARRAKDCFFVTRDPTGGTISARPMNVRRVDDEGNLWFLSADDSHKNQELERDPATQLFFQSTNDADFLLINGRATVVHDRTKVKQLWEPTLITWFPGGVEDPRITAIKVAPVDGYYWDTKGGDALAGVKMLLGAALKKPANDSVEGSLSV